MNRDQILENRRKWIDYLKQPTTKKGVDRLSNSRNTEERCCLGHACHVIGIPYDRENNTFDSCWSYPPESLVEALGLWDRAGSCSSWQTYFLPGGKFRSLATWNDDSDVTPQEIGAYLETVIEGGPETPFKPLELL